MLGGHHDGAEEDYAFPLLEKFFSLHAYAMIGAPIRPFTDEDVIQ